MKKTASLFFVLSLMMTSFTISAQNLRGDVDYDGRVTIDDVTSLIDYLLSDQWPEGNHEWVDLGLPSGTLWATCNVGANSPEDFGDYFAWGEVSPKEVYNWSTYKWYNSSNNALTKYCTSSDYGPVDNKTELDPEDDVAYVSWGASWRMPTQEQYLELMDKCTLEWFQRNGVNGFLVIGPNGNTMFLPAAGFRLDDELFFYGTLGYYWSRTLYSNTTYNAHYLGFYSSSVDWCNGDRSNGLVVRAVRASHT